MVGIMKKHTSHWWWLDSQHNAKSPWLQSTLSELDEKTEAMLRLIDEDADSFAQRAEMYYKKRPELISMVEDFYRAHRSLAERYDQIKSETATRLLTSLGSPFTSPRSSISSVSPIKYCQEKAVHSADRNYVSFSENFDHEDSGDSEVEDPEEEMARDRDVLTWVSDEEVRKFKEEIDRLREERQLSLMKLEEMHGAFSTGEVRKLKEEIDRLREENGSQKFQMMQKDEQLKMVMRQLSLAKEAAVSSQVRDDEIMKLKEEIDRLREENESQKFQMMQKDEEMELVMRQLSLAKEAAFSIQVRDDEIMKLKEETERVKDEIQKQNQQTKQKDEEERDMIMQFGLLQKEEMSDQVIEDGLRKLKGEIDRLQDEVSMQKDQIKQTIEDKEELIRQLGVAREVNSWVINTEVQELKEELNRGVEQNMTQKVQIKQAIEDKEELIRQLGVVREANSQVINNEVPKLKEEMIRLEEQNMTQKDQIKQAIEEEEELIRQLGVARGANSWVINNEVQKLKGEINRLEEKNMTQKYQLLQKDEEKREVIRQLGMAVDVLKEENLMLRKYVMRNLKKRSAFELNSFLRKLFNGSTRSQSLVGAP